MELNILYSGDTLDNAKAYANNYFEEKVRIAQIDLSMFEQYRFYPIKKWIPKLWSYRIVAKNGKFHFGTINLPHPITDNGLFD